MDLTYRNSPNIADTCYSLKTVQLLYHRKVGVKVDIHRYLYGTNNLDLLLYKLRYDHVKYQDNGYLIPYNAISHTDVIVVKFS